MEHDRPADRGMKLDQLLVQVARFDIARRRRLVGHELGVASRQELGQCLGDEFLGRRCPVGVGLDRAAHGHLAQGYVDRHEQDARVGRIAS